MKDLLLVYALVAVCLVFTSLAPTTARADDTAGDAVADAATVDAHGDSMSAEELATVREKSEKFAFEADVSRLMGIIINSLYSNKEIFLRELISNASDALDKIRFASLTDASVLGDGEQAKLDIRIRADKEAKLLHITDRGVGMTKQDLLNNLGTIAKSGTKEFVQQVSDGVDDNMNLIGQFGVGFYSVFLVADRVWVTSKHNDDEQYVWESDAEQNFSVALDPRGNTLGRGTRITLQLKEEHEDYLNESVLTSLSQKYSEFINFPIYIWKSHSETEEVPIDDDDDDDDEKKDDNDADDEDKLKVDDDDAADDDKKPKTKSVQKTVWDWEQLNETKPIWTRPSRDITEDEYVAFYKAITKGQDEPLSYTHFVGEGEVDFKAILYIPDKMPEGAMDGGEQRTRPIRLYVRRVFINDKLDEVMPKYLSFLRGVVDSDDLPLNVSREVFQKTKSLEVIRKKLVRKAIAMFQMLADDEENKEKWDKFYKAFAVALKYGVINDRLNRTRLSKLLRYESSKSDGELTSFESYVGRMKEDQKEIYYLTGDSIDAVKNSPLIERLVRKGFEVLYMADPIDAYAIDAFEKYDGKYKFTNVGKDNQMSLSDKDEQKELEEQFKPLTAYLKRQLGSSVEKVAVSQVLTKTPSALLAGQWGWTAHMEKIVKAQALGSKEQAAFMAPRKTWQINPRHPLIKNLLERVSAAGDDADDDSTLQAHAQLLFDNAIISSGFELDKPQEFAARVHRMMQVSLGLDADAVADEEPEEEEAAAADEPADEADADADADAAADETKEEL